MYIARIPNRGSPPAVLLRESFREGDKVKTRTLANLSRLPADAIALLQRYLKGETFLTVDEAFDEVDSWHHGHVDAVLRAMRRLVFERLIASRRSAQRDLVVGMVAGRILEPDKNKNSKLANTRWWNITTLPELLGVEGADEDDLYGAMDWLLKRQKRIEDKLAARHLTEGGLVLYDLTSSYFEGVTCPLAALGHPHDGAKGKLQVNYGLLTDERGRPISVSVFEGNTSDSKTVMPQVAKVRDRFGIRTMVLVGDRGMITQKLIEEELGELEGIEWITALRSPTIRKLVDEDHVQLGLFDKRNLFEVTHHPDFPGERLVACRNQELAKLREQKRRSLLDATVKLLDEVRLVVERGKLQGEDKIKARANTVVKQYAVAAHVELDIGDAEFAFRVKDDQQAAEATLSKAFRLLDGVCSLVRQGKLKGKKNITKRASRVVDKYGIGKCITLDVGANNFDFHVDDKKAAREAALGTVCEELDKIRLLVERGRFGGKDRIGVRIGKVVDKYKVAKHIVLDIRDDGFHFHIDEDKVSAEAALDGVYIIRTSVSAGRLSADDVVRSYKSLSQVERAFLSLKTIDIKVRPIRHRLEQRVRAHIFLSMLAYYVEWHMREAWRPLIFADEDQEAKKTRDPVAPATRSRGALRKAHSKLLDDGTQVHSYQTLLKSLSQIVRNRCRLKGTGADGPSVDIVTTPNPVQQRAYDLLNTITV